ncbi:MAG: XisI protein [Polyangiales bacterium]
MDAVTRYRALVRGVIEDYARTRPANGDIDVEVLFDAERDRYELMHVGWDGPRRVHGSVLHLDIIGGKIWIQHDGTNRPVADELVRAGVPRDAIVLAFHPPYARVHTDYAVG